MLGHKLCQHLSPQMDTWATVRRDSDVLRGTGFVDDGRILDAVDARKPETVQAAIDAAEPDVVVNCIGIVKQLPEAQDPALLIETNSLFPHHLAGFCSDRGIYLVHISTDCVFSGQRGMYTEEDPPDAQELYGRSKALGEIVQPNCLTLRTSIIGRELRGQHGLLEWFIAQQGQSVHGYTRAVFSGLTTQVLSEMIGTLIARKQRLEGLFQIASSPISKHDLLSLVRDTYSLPVEIEPFPDIVVDRSLDGTRFYTETGLSSGSWVSMVGRLANDPFDYDDWRQAHDA